MASPIALTDNCQLKTEDSYAVISLLFRLTSYVQVRSWLALNVVFSLLASETNS